MIKGEFEFTIVSAYDREKLTCEIWYKNECFAEITQETETLLFEIYPTENNKIWKIPLKEIQEAIEYGKNFLLDKIE